MWKAIIDLKPDTPHRVPVSIPGISRFQNQELLLHSIKDQSGILICEEPDGTRTLELRHERRGRSSHRLKNLFLGAASSRVTVSGPHEFPIIEAYDDAKVA